jgi:hypothetical protein
MDGYIRFSCEKCKFKIKALEKYAGKKGKCPKCKAMCIIPKEEYTISDIEKDLAELGLEDALHASGTGINIKEW